MLTTQSEGLLRALDLARGEFLDYLENAHGHARQPQAAPASVNGMGAAAMATGPEMESTDVRRV